ncbi:hypothetical protein BDC45DRAFT_525859 [Circinella umbellata]|nr:hypothetical protein BDC45DRAFT_525859 [Circinella umbellata]
MVATIVIQGVVTRDPVFRNRQRMVGDRLVDQPSVTFSVYCDQVYYKVVCGSPHWVSFVVENNIEDGTSIVVQGRFQVVNYTNNRGARAASFRIIASKLRLASGIDIQVRSASQVDVSADVTAAGVIARLRRSNLLNNNDGAQMTEVSAEEHLVLASLQSSSLVVNSGASAVDLLERLRPLVRQITHREHLAPEQVVGLLPDGVTLSQTATLINEITPPPPSEPSTRSVFRAEIQMDEKD